jgi:hypothetical protein
MYSKKLIYLFMTIGSIAGGYAPVLFGISGFSFTSLFTGALGAIAGIWLGYRLSR